MNFQKVVDCKYTLDVSEVNGLKQTKVILQDICNLFEQSCSNCPLENNCPTPQEFDGLIDDIINNNGETYYYEV